MNGKPNSVSDRLYSLTDTGNAEMFADMFREMVRYDMATGGWLSWDGARWSREAGKSIAEYLSRMVAGEWRSRIAAAPTKEDRKPLLAHWEYCCSCRGMQNMMRMAQSDRKLVVTADNLDQWPMLFNCINGTLDLKTGLLRDHDPNDLITQLAPVNWDDSAECALWDRSLSDWHPDGGEDGTWEYLQQLAGYCLTGDTSSRCFPIFWGGGKNGKSVFIETLIHMMGDYATVASRTLVEAGDRTEHPTELADLWGKRLVLASEPKKGTRLKSSLVKSMTGDSLLTARFMRGDFFHFSATHKTIMLTQNLPKVDESSDAIWDRLHKVPWRVRISAERQDPRLTEKLKVEWSGILRWAMQGCLNWQKPPGMLMPTKKIVRETEDYRSDQNPARKFVESVLIVGNGLFLSNGSLVNLMTQWNEFAEEDLLNMQEVKSWLKEHGCTSGVRRVHGATSRGWLGVGVRSE